MSNEKNTSDNQQGHAPLAGVSCWRFIKGDQNKVNLIEMPENENFEMLFDDGSVCEFYDDDMPFAEVIAWRPLACS